MKFDWIEPGVLAASELPMGKADIQALHEQGVRAIVTLTEKPLTIQKDITPELLAKLDMTTLHVPVVDFQPPKGGQVYQVTEFIDQMQSQGRPVFLHCYAGQGRTGTLLHAYYLLKGLSLEAAKAKVKSQRANSQFSMLSTTQKAFLETFAKQVCR
jgi:atypical dual specificity phosphatase